MEALTHEQVRAIVAGIWGGLDADAAAEAAGVSRETFAEAMKAGIAGEEAHRPLVDAVERALRGRAFADETDQRRRWLYVVPGGKEARKKPRPEHEERLYRFRRLFELPRWEEIHDRLADGHAIPDVARVMQEDLRLLPAMARRTLVNLLTHYRAEVIGLVVLGEPDPAIEDMRKRLDARLEAKVDAYEHYRWLLNVQQYRVRRGVDIEDMTGMHSSALWQDLDVYRKTVADFVQFQIETGLIKRSPIPVDVTARGEVRVLNGRLDLGAMLAEEVAIMDECRQAATRYVALLDGARGNGAEH